MSLFTRVAAWGFFLTTAASAATFAPPNPLTSVKYGPGGVPARASVATNGHGFMGVVQTNRDQRVARIGVGETNTGVLIGERLGLSAIAASGGRYVVATTIDTLVASFVDEKGNPIGDTIPIQTEVITSSGSGASDRYAPRIAANAGAIGIVYIHASSSQGGLEVALLAATGGIIRRGVVLDPRWIYTHDEYDIAASAEGMAVVTSSSAGGVRLMILDDLGNIQKTTILELPLPLPRPLNELTFQVAIASDGHGYVVLWTAHGGVLRAASIDASGAVRQIADIADQTPPSSPYRLISRPAIAFDGQAYLCGYLDGYPNQGTPYVARIDSLLTISQRLPLQPLDARTRDADDITVSAGNGSAMVVWAETTRADGLYATSHVSHSGYLYGATIAGDTLSAPFPVVVAATEQLAPSAASNGTETLIAWNEQTLNTNTINAGLLDSAGRWRDLGAIAPSHGASCIVSSTGRDFLVAWSGGAVRIDASGSVLDARPIGLPELFTPTSTVWDGQRYVVAGSLWPGPVNAVLTIGADGVAGVPRIVRPRNDGDYVWPPALAWSGSSYLMTFPWRPACEASCPRVSGAHALLLTPALDPVTEVPIGDDEYAYSTAVAWNGIEFLAVSVYGKASATRVSADGTTLGPVRFPAVGYWQELRGPAVVTTGADFLVKWRSSNDYFPISRYLSVVHPDGSVSDPLVIDTATMTSDIALINQGGRELSISSQWIPGAPYYGASRVTIQATGAVMPVAAPTLTAMLNGSGITLQWTAVANATEYRIEYRSGNDQWIELDPARNLSTSLPVRLLSNTARSEFRVRAWNSDGDSPYSNSVSAALPRRRAF